MGVAERLGEAKEAHRAHRLAHVGQRVGDDAVERTGRRGDLPRPRAPGQTAVHPAPRIDVGGLTRPRDTSA